MNSRAVAICPSHSRADSAHHGRHSVCASHQAELYLIHSLVAVDRDRCRRDEAD